MTNYHSLPRNHINPQYDPNSDGVAENIAVNLSPIEELQLNMINDIAHNNYENSLTQNNYDDAFYDIFINQDKISSSTDVEISTGTGGKITLGWSGGFDLSNASYNSGEDFDVSGQASTPKGVTFNSNGSKMFTLEEDGKNVSEYSLSTSFDVSTASYTDSFDVSQDQYPMGFAFSSDGTKMFIVGYSNKNIYEYSLSTGFDISTASYTDSFDISGQASYPTGVAFNSDGSKMFVAGQDTSNIYEYSLGTAFDALTASYTDSFDVSGQDADPTGVTFNSDGSKMFVVGKGNNSVNEYSLSNPFDISTASYTDSFDVSGQDGRPQGVAFSSFGTKIFVVGSNNDKVYEYLISCPGHISNGQITSTTKSLSFTPSKIIIQQNADIPTDEDIQYELYNSSNDLITTITQSEVGSEVSISASDTSFYVIPKLSTSDGNDTPTLNEYGVLFV